MIFAGHRVDEAGRARFPPDRELRARQLIHGHLQQFAAAGTPLKVLASAAPGSDILCHEICKELAIGSTICLPMPVADFSSGVFENLDGWRSRFLALADGCSPLQLSDQAGLPHWLHGTGINCWERGNHWVLEMALTGARKVSLVALWDGKPTGDAEGGTAHMVCIARDAGMVDISIIDAKDLLSDAARKPAP